MVLPVLSSVFVFLSIVSFGTWQLQRSRGGGAEARVRNLASEREAYERLQDVPFEHRVVLPLAEGLTRAVISLLPPAFIARTRHNLIAAGQPMSLPTFFLFVILVGAFLPLTGFLLAWAATDGDLAPGMIVFIPILALVGVFIPFIWLRRRVRGRQMAIWRSLPDAFDLMTTCVEAGLGLDSAFNRVAEKLKGPVSEEFAEMLREVSMGKARRDALRDMGERTGVGDLKTFANMIVQAEELGTSLGAALRVQASDIRRHRRQRAEEEARRAPAKMVFPLVFFILPSLFVVILGPVMIELVKVLGD
jgi:tight adherence protein C